MTDVTENQDQAEAEMPTAHAHVLRELAERSRAGGPKLTSAGGLLGKLTEMAVEGGWREHQGFVWSDDPTRHRHRARPAPVVSAASPSADARARYPRNPGPRLRLNHA